MSQQKQCPFCKRAIRLRDKFCPFCGRYVLESAAPQSVYSRVTQPAPPPRMDPQPGPGAPAPTQPIQGAPPGAQPAPFMSQAPQAAPEPETLSEDVIDQIALRAELEQLDQTMAEIRSKLEDLGEMISKIEVTHEIETKIKDFKNKIKEIKVKREKLNADKRDLPFEADLTEKKEIQERLKKLNEAYRSKEVAESAFKRLRGEYEQKIQAIDAKSQSFKAKINTWIKKIKSEKAQAVDQLELLKARFAAGEMGEAKYNLEKEESEEKLKRYDNVLKYLSGKL